jgi:hypothetical protein
VVLGGRAERLNVFHRPQEVRLLQEDGGGLIVDRLGQGQRVSNAVGERDLDQVGAVTRTVGHQGLAAVRMDAPGGDQFSAPGLADRQVGGRGDGRRALVERRVRDREAGELRHRGLELEHHLEPALRDLGLVRRVGGQELRPARDRVDDRRHVVVVHSGP